MVITAASVISDLRARLAVVTAPDRELDAEISWRLGPPAPPSQAPVALNLAADITGPKVFDAMVSDWRERDDIVPRYTASVDAALGLAGAGGLAILRRAVARPLRADLPLTPALAIHILDEFLGGLVQGHACAQG